MIRYTKIFLHVLFWVGLVVLLNSSMLNLDWGPFSYEKDTLLIPLLYGMIFNIALLYTNAYWLIPKYLHRKRISKFWGISALILIGVTLIEVLCDIGYLYYLEEFRRDALEADNSTNISSNLVLDFMIWLGSVFIVNLFFWAVAFLYRFPNDYKRGELAKQQLIQDKLTAELDFLKAQINPHFLFNGINNIYHLIGNDDKQAREVLLQFSSLLRYQLYECDDEFIPLKNELNYLKNYILLEQVRKGQDADIEVQLPDDEELDSLNGLKIAPLLLTPFLENAFKYLSLFSQKEDNRLSIQISVLNGELSFSVENTIDPSAVQKGKSKGAGGIGLENVKRRLALLYPEKHKLTISDNGDRFSVTLKINLQ